MKYPFLSFTFLAFFLLASCKSENRYDSYYIEAYDDNSALWSERGGVIVVDKQTGKYYRITSDGYSPQAEAENYYRPDTWVKGKTLSKQIQKSRIIEVNPQSREVIVHDTKVKLDFNPEVVMKK